MKILKKSKIKKKKIITWSWFFDLNFLLARVLIGLGMGLFVDHFFQLSDFFLLLVEN